MKPRSDNQANNNSNSKWDNCIHQWRVVDSMYNSDKFEDVICTICGCPGERTIETDTVYWPTT